MMLEVASTHIAFNSSSLSWLSDVTLGYQHFKQSVTLFFDLSVSARLCINDRSGESTQQILAEI